MHELGIAFEIIKTIEELAKDNNIQIVKKTTLEIGEVSTIVPSYLEDVWKWAVERSEVMKGCKLEIEIIPAITICEDCGEKYSTLKFAKICPKCKSEHTHLLQGDETNIKEIEV